jgi:multidrug efflux pump subunit AcrB
MVLATLDERARLADFRPDADPTQPEIQVRRDRERATALGLSSRDIGETIATAVEGTIPTQLQRGERLVDVRVRLDKESIRSAAQLQRLPLFVSGNRRVRLADVATIESGRTPGEIQRINQRDVFILAGTLAEGASLGEALAEVDGIVRSLDLPPGVSVLPSTAAESNRELQASIILLGALAVFLVFIVMAVQYDSLVDPLVILFTVPLALAGGVVGLWVTGTAIGATVLIGVVLLVGVIVGNGIILVELANQIRERDGIGRREAMLKAAPARLRPITMTTMIAVLGLLPLAMGVGEGTELLRPLGITVLSGLSLGTLLTLFVVPSLYLTLHDLFRWNLLGTRPAPPGELAAAEREQEPAVRA